MLPQPSIISDCLTRNPGLSDSRRFVVAFSGGLDSTVLLDLIRRALPRHDGTSLLAVHVDHGLHPQSKTWSAHCATVARRLGVEFVGLEVIVSTASGASPEAAAREARYDALARHIGPGDVLLCAHHRDDQAETVLLQLLRGAGVAGIAGMPELAAFRSGWCLRPLLDIDRRQLLDYASRYGLTWVDDPSNTDNRYDRNYLRNEVLPKLQERWPAATTALARSASHCASATRLLGEIGSADTALLSPDNGSLELAALRTLSTDRQLNALRCWIQDAGLPTPGTAHLAQLQKLAHGEAPVGCVSWPGCEVRRYRDRLYAMLPLAPGEPGFDAQLGVDSSLWLPSGLGRLRCGQATGRGLDPRSCDPAFRVRFRAGGEKIRPCGSPHTRELRTLYQEAGVVPWMRDRIPLLYAGDRLAAVGNLWMAQELTVRQGETGLVVDWDGHPLLY